MNTRIKDLALDCIVETLNDSGHWVFNDAELDKFAKQIIQECIAEVSMVGISNSHHDDISWAACKSIELIKSRFAME